MVKWELGETGEYRPLSQGDSHSNQLLSCEKEIAVLLNLKLKNVYMYDILFKNVRNIPFCKNILMKHVYWSIKASGLPTCKLWYNVWFHTCIFKYMLVYKIINNNKILRWGLTSHFTFLYCYIFCNTQIHLKFLKLIKNMT